MDPTHTISETLIDEIRSWREDMRSFRAQQQQTAVEFGRLTEKLENTAQRQLESVANADRITRVEVRLEVAEKAADAQSRLNRWLIGLVVMALIGVAGIAVNVLLHFIR